MPHGLQHAPDLAVAPLRNRHAIPAIGALAPALVNGAKGRHAVLELHTIEQALLFLVAQSAQHAHRVLPLQAKARVHEPVGQFPRAGEQQQAFGVQIQPPNRLPFALHQPRQLAEHRRAVLRVIVRHDFPRRLVIGNHTRGWRRNTKANGLAVDLDLITKLHALPDMGGLVIHRNTPLKNELLHLQARTHAGLGQHLVQLGRLRLGQQHAFGGRHLGVSLILVELARDHVGKPIAFAIGRRLAAPPALRATGVALRFLAWFFGLLRHGLLRE